MNASERMSLAEKLRDQGLADLMVARAGMRMQSFKIGLQTMTCNHLVVAKCQQSAEKLLKAFFVWHGESVNPFRGHSPLQDVLEGTGGNSSRVEKFRTSVRRETNGFLSKMSWLETLAPSGPPLSGSSLPNMAVSDLKKNSEYPFFDVGKAGLICPAEYFSYAEAIQAIRVVYLLCKVLSGSDDTAFGIALDDFLRDNPLGD